MCDFFRLISRSNPAEHFETERFTRWYSPVPHPWFTGVLSSELPKDGDEAFVAEVIEHFRQKDVNTFTWWLEPPLKPSDWQSILSAHGFGFSDDTPGMAVDLQALNESTPKIAELEIRTVADDEALRTWINVFVPDYIDADHGKMSAKFNRIPALSDVPFPVQMEPNLVVEFYSR